MRARGLVWMTLACLFSFPINAQVQVGPAPNGDAAVIALRVILENFDPPDCPKIQSAYRMHDGGIHAVCTNQEIFRVFSVNGQDIAMRCSALRRMGISAC